MVKNQGRRQRHNEKRSQDPAVSYSDSTGLTGKRRAVVDWLTVEFEISPNDRALAAVSAYSFALNKPRLFESMAVGDERWCFVPDANCSLTFWWSDTPGVADIHVHGDGVARDGSYERGDEEIDLYWDLARLFAATVLDHFDDLEAYPPGLADDAADGARFVTTYHGPEDDDWEDDGDGWAPDILPVRTIRLKLDPMGDHNRLDAVSSDDCTEDGCWWHVLSSGGVVLGHLVVPDYTAVEPTPPFTFVPTPGLDAGQAEEGRRVAALVVARLYLVERIRSEYLHALVYLPPFDAELAASRPEAFHANRRTPARKVTHLTLDLVSSDSCADLPSSAGYFGMFNDSVDVIVEWRDGWRVHIIPNEPEQYTHQGKLRARAFTVSWTVGRSKVTSRGESPFDAETTSAFLSYARLAAAQSKTWWPRILELGDSAVNAVLDGDDVAAGWHHDEAPPSEPEEGRYGDTELAHFTRVERVPAGIYAQGPEQDEAIVALAALAHSAALKAAIGILTP